MTCWRRRNCSIGWRSTESNCTISMSSRTPPLEKLYLAGQVPLFSRDEYVALVVDFLERLNPNMIVHRLSGETYRAITVAPEWSIDKLGVHNAIL